MARAPEQLDQNDAIVVPRVVLDGIEAVRRSGAVNMLDRPRVVELADRLGFPETVLWVHDYAAEYARGVFHGFRAEPDDNGEPEPVREAHPDRGAPDA